MVLVMGMVGMMGRGSPPHVRTSGSPVSSTGQALPSQGRRLCKGLLDGGRFLGQDSGFRRNDGIMHGDGPLALAEGKTAHVSPTLNGYPEHREMF